RPPDPSPHLRRCAGRGRRDARQHPLVGIGTPANGRNDLATPGTGAATGRIIDSLIETPMILDLFKLNGRVALVTGGRRGLGQGMAYGLAQAGADIACVSKSGEAAETRQLVESTGRRFVEWQVDLA